MNVLIVANCKAGKFSPFVVEQVDAIRAYGIDVDYFGVVGKGALGYLKNIKELNRKIKEFKPDVIHAHYGLSALLANLQRMVPVVATYHGSDINMASIRRFSKMAIFLSKYNIFVSAKTRDIVNSKYKSELIPCGIDLKLYGSLPRREVRKKYNFTDNERLVLFAGAFDNQVKNSTLAKKAVSLLPNVKLIELKGYTRQQVIELMYASDVFLMTSFTEGSPQVIKEAMACNRPIVSTDVGDVGWVIGDTEGCYICSLDPQDCADKIRQAIEFSKTMGSTNGRKRIEELGLDNKIVAQKIVEIYKKSNCKEIKILIYVSHPAQFHFFKHIIRKLKKDGYQVKLLLKTKDILEELAIKEGFDYINIQKTIRNNNIFAIAIASFVRTFKVFKIARKYKADILLGTDASVAQAAKLLGIVGITTLEDDVEIIARMAKITFPFSSDIVVPSVCRVGKWEAKKVPYCGYMKLAYLHPNYFTPNRDIVKKYIEEDKYCIVRLAQLTAYHDVDIQGLNVDLVLNVLDIAEKHGCKIYISSEGCLNEKLQPYQLKIEHTDIHHIMSFASLLISDSQSMSVEAAMLGIPSLRFSDFSGRISVLEELETKYKLTSGIKTSNSQELLEKVEQILSNSNSRDTYLLRRQKMLTDKIDVTAFMVWFIENYPLSNRIMKENPDYQYRFK